MNVKIAKTSPKVAPQPRKIEIEISVPDPGNLNDSFWEMDTFVQNKAKETSAFIGRNLQQGKDATQAAFNTSASFVGEQYQSGKNLASIGLHHAGAGIKSGLKAAVPFSGLKYGREIREQLKAGDVKDNNFNNLSNVGIGVGQAAGIGSAALSGISYVAGYPQAGSFFLNTAGLGFGLAAASGLAFGVAEADYQPPATPEPVVEVAQAEPKETEKSSELWEAFKNRDDRALPLAGGLAAVAGIATYGGVVTGSAAGAGATALILGLPALLIGSVAGAAVDAYAPSNGPV